MASSTDRSPETDPERIPLQDMNTPDRQMTLTEFIKEHIKQRVCKTYIKTKKSNADNCQCGRPIQWHTDAQISTVDGSTEEWISDKHTKSVECTAFGEIKFQGTRIGNFKTPRPYLRLQPNTDMDAVWKILRKFWCLPKTNLIISVTGGARQFEVKPGLMRVFKQGLIRAAISTGAWIVTGGTATGVMKYVGEAVRDYVITSSKAAEQNKPIALGIATWGVIANRERLDDDQSSRGRFPVIVNSAEIEDKKRETILDDNHTHFLLVDNGSEHKYGAEIDFRSNLETFISTKYVDTGAEVKVPVVLIVLEGGPNTLETASKSLKNKTPVVVIKGSQRSADFISMAYELTRSQNNEDNSTFPDNFSADMREAAKTMYDWQGKNDETIDEEANKLVKQVEEMMKENRYLINVFDLEESSGRKLDEAVLYALLRAKKTNARTQLSLALAWNRCDIVHQEIFTPDIRGWKNWQQISKLDKYDALSIALGKNRPEFVQLLLDRGVVIEDFLTVKTLYNLYSNILAELPNSYARVLSDMIKKNGEKWRDANLLQDVASAIQNLMGDQQFNDYGGECYALSDISALTFQWEGNRDTMQQTHEFEHPYRELFLWAILLNRREFARYFWMLGKDQIGSALLARCLLKAMSSKAKCLEEKGLCNELLDHSEYFERVAIQVLSRCYSKDKLIAHQLLVRKLTMWQDLTLFQLAKIGRAKDFMGDTCCQTKLYIIWNGCMANDTTMKNLKNDVGNGNMEQNTDNGDTPRLLANAPVDAADESDSPIYAESGSNTSTRQKNVGCIKRAQNPINLFSAFFEAPVVRFCVNVVGYLVFLSVFSFFILTDLRPIQELSQTSIPERIVLFWIGAMMLEEMQQLLSRDGSSLKSKLKSWGSSDWNLFDLVMLLFSLVSIVLRFSLMDANISAVRIFYSLTLTLYFLRSLQYFYITRYVGPKVIMISKMLKDVGFFCMILFLFLVSFGVAYHANLYPNSAPSWSLVKRVLYMPYWQMYGELFLDDINGDPMDTCTRNASINSEEGDMAQCADSAWIVLIYLAVYMIVTNILLVNLLIAMFSYTFQKVQANSEKVWHFNRYSIVYEYAVRRSILPPVVILSILLWVVRKIFKCNKERYPNVFRQKLNTDDDSRRTIFERSAMEECTIAANEGREQIDTQVFSTVDRASNDIAQMKCINDLNVKLEKQGGQLEKLVEQLEKQWGQLEKQEEQRKKQWGQLEKQEEQRKKQWGQFEKRMEQLVQH